MDSKTSKEDVVDLHDQVRGLEGRRQLSELLHHPVAVNLDALVAHHPSAMEFPLAFKARRSRGRRSCP
jgi:hypothetical protein